jgi:hypothetical protein
MRSRGLQRILVLAFALVAGCGDATNADGDGETTVVGPTTGVDPSTGVADDGLCVAGYEGCPCFDDARCISGLRCLSNHCVTVPDASSTDDTTPSEESTSTAAESSSGGATEESSSSSDGESSSTGIPAVCVDDDTYCDDEELQTCVDGQWVLATCEETCGLTGYASGGCGNADGCLCAGHSDEVCDTGTYNHCNCIDVLFGVVSCTFAQSELEYQACFADTTTANTCWSTYSVQAIEDCEMAVVECGA